MHALATELTDAFDLRQRRLLIDCAGQTDRQGIINVSLSGWLGFECFGSGGLDLVGCGQNAWTD